MATQQIDLSAILAFQPQQQPFNQQQYAAPQNLAAAAPTKKKPPTADQKREKAVLDILDHKDQFGLIYAGLLLQLDQASLEALVLYVKAKHNRQ
jgi:hypothetical protein